MTILLNMGTPYTVDVLHYCFCYCLEKLYLRVFYIYTLLFLFSLMPFTHELRLSFISFTSKEKSCVVTAAGPATLYREWHACRKCFQEWQESSSFSRMEVTTVDEVIGLQKPYETLAGAFRRSCI